MALEPREIGRRIAAAREAKGWTQLDFAYEAGKSPSTISRWERGELPTVRELMRIAGVLEVPAEELVEPLSADGATDQEGWRLVLEAVAEQREALRLLLEELLERLPPAKRDSRRGPKPG